MTRGNQREIDRQRAANRHAKGGGEAKAGDPLARRVRGQLPKFLDKQNLHTIKNISIGKRREGTSRESCSEEGAR
ncbi:hypothetical protein EON65_07490 [archaeon]|nr:MAG: hypothetical protein EON65_07490 [archaeon]